MGDDKKKKAKPGFYRIGSAFIWAAGMGIAAWKVPELDQNPVYAAFGGLVAGWGTATLLGFFGRAGARGSIMAVAGLVIGVCVASGALAIATSLPMVMFRGSDAVQFDWDAFLGFVFKVGVLPSAILGVLTGLYIHGKFNKEKK